MYPNRYQTPPPPGYMYTYHTRDAQGVQHTMGQYVMQSGPQYKHPGKFVCQYLQPTVLQSPSVLQLQAPPDVLPQMPVIPSQQQPVAQQVTPSQPVQMPSPVMPSPVTPLVIPQTSSSNAKNTPGETPKHESEIEEESLAEPLKSEMDDDNCVYFKISKSDINKPEIARLLSDALGQKLSEVENSSSKVTSSDVLVQDQTQITSPPIINEVIVKNKPPVQHVQPVAFVPLPAQPVVQTYYVSHPPPATNSVIPGSSGFVFSILLKVIGTSNARVTFNHITFSMYLCLS